MLGVPAEICWTTLKMWMPVWLHCSPVNICKYLQGQYSWYLGSNALFTCISGAVAMGRVSACPPIDQAPNCCWWQKCISWFSFISKEFNLSHPVTFHNKKTEEKSKWWWLGGSVRKCKAYSGVCCKTVAPFNSSHGFARTVCWIALKSLGCICYFQQKSNQVM